MALLCYMYLESFRPASGVPSDDISAAASSKYGVLVDVLPLVVSDGWYWLVGDHKAVGSVAKHIL